MVEEAKDRKEYYRMYYDVKREELSKKRRSRYQDDPVYCERVKEASRKHRKKKRAERARLRKEGKLPSPIVRTGAKPPQKIEIGGKEFSAYTITTLALRVGRTVSVVNNWARAGLLPATPLRSGRGDRLYTDLMIEAVQKAVDGRERVSASDDTFPKEIEKAWEKIGVFDG